MQAETVHLCPEGLLRGGKAEKMQRDRPADPQTEANPRRQLHSPCSDDANDANKSEVEGSGFTFCSSSSRGERREEKGGWRPRPPPAVFLPLALLCDKRLPPLQHHRHPYNLSATRELSRGGGPDLPACIWLTGDWEGALRAHVTINNPC